MFEIWLFFSWGTVNKECWFIMYSGGQKNSKSLCWQQLHMYNSTLTVNSAHLCFHLHWDKIEETCFLSFFFKELFFLCSSIICIMYVLCTSLEYHLSTQDHSLYTFAQSTQCLYIYSYFESLFLYMCMCQIWQKTMKRDKRKKGKQNCLFEMSFFLLSLCKR